MTVSPALLAGRYRLREPLGTGGMGRVWLARDEVLHRDVAVKEVDIPAHLAGAERAELRVRTLREARTAAALSHPNVVQIYDVLGIDDRPWIVMEFVKSRSLQQILAGGPITPHRAAEIGLAVLRALAAAHSAGVLHRDVKPGNVLVADDGRVVLTDFGLATFDGGESSVTRPGLVWGSPEYVAPERAKHGISSADADLWSLGATLYAAVEGSSPYARPTAMATLTALATEKPPSAPHAGPLKPVITGLLRKEPRARLRVGEVERMLLRIAEGDLRGAGRARRPPRQRAGEPTSGAGEPASGAGTDRVPIPSYALPEAPVEAGPAVEREAEPARPGRRGWVVAGTAVAVAAMIAAAAMFVAQSRTSPRSAGAGGGLPAASTPSTGSTGAGSAAGAAGGPAAAGSIVGSTPAEPGDRVAPHPGWAYYEEPGRFRMVAPLGWIVDRRDTVTRIHEPDGPKVIVIDRWPAPPDGAVAAAQARSEAWSSGLQDPPADYRPVELRPIQYFDSGLQWEYTYTDPTTGAVRALSRWFVAAGVCYSVAVTIPAYDVVGRTGYFDVLIGGFQPR